MIPVMRGLFLVWQVKIEARSYGHVGCFLHTGNTGIFTIVLRKTDIRG